VFIFGSDSLMVPRLQIAAAAALFSTGGVFIKLTDLDAWQVAGARSAVAAVFFAALYRVGRSAFTWRSAAAGAAYAATMLGFVVANKLTTAANSIFLQYTAPLYVALLAPWLLGERRRRHDGPVCALIAAGLALFLGGGDPVFATAPNPFLGNVVAAIDGLFWALTLLSVRWLGADRERLAGSLILGNVFAAAVAAPLALSDPDIAAGPLDLAAVLYLGIFQIGVAYWFMTAGMRRVATLEASILLLMEPVLSAGLAWTVYREMPGTWSIAGAALVTIATAAKTIGDNRAGVRSGD
jgi:drug/metabolite transporter, DME family